MAIGFDNAVDGGSLNGSFAYGHVCSGTQRALVVGVFCNGAGDTITAVSHNGNAMTAIGPATVSGTSKSVYLFYLLNPSNSPGAQVSITKSGSTDSAFAVSASYTGVDTPIDSTNTGNSASAGTFAISTTTVRDLSWAVSVARCEGAGSFTAGANTTLRKTNAGTSNTFGIVDSNADLTPAGSKTLNYADSSNGAWGGCILSFKRFAFSFSQAATDTVVTSDAIKKATVKTITETIVTSDSAAETTNRWKSESAHTGTWVNDNKSI